MSAARRVALGALLAGLAVPASGGPIRFEEAGGQAGARVLHHTRTFSGKHADVLGMFTSGGASSVAADYDGDGDLDLFVVDSELGKPHHLLRNELVPSGRLAFTDVAAEAGATGGNDAKSIVSDALWLDADNDGRPDLLLARFGTPLLFRNRGGGKLEDVSAASGLDKFGNSIAAIAFDADNDGRLDLLLGNYFKPVNLIDLPTPHVLPDNLDDARNGGGATLWKNVTEPGSGKIRFVEVTEKAGLAHHTGWTLDAGHADFDNDGWEDIFAANGLRSAGPENYIPVLVEMIVRPGVDFTDLNNWPLIGDRSWSGYQKKKLFRNLGDQMFKEIAAEAGVDNDRDGRGVTAADFDHDGRLDLYQTNADQEALLYRNVSGGTGHWLELTLVGTKSNRDAIGARVTVRAGGQTWIREVNGGNGYAGQSPTRLHVGLGAVDKIDSIEIRWPSGLRQKVSAPLDRLTTIREGEGT